MSRKKKSERRKGFIHMESTPKMIVLQTGRQTPPDSLLWDLDFINGISMQAKRLGTDFLGGGVASFVLITVSENADTSALANAMYQHTQRLKKRGDDDLVILLGGKITTDEEEVSFKDVKCRKQTSLKGKSQEEITEALQGALAEAP
jgi:hypothetical protein